MIRIQGLHKRFGPTVAVRGIDLEVGKGECFGLIGPNGAGKTTTLKTLATLVKPDSGSVFVNEIPVEREPRKVRRIVGYMPDIFQSYGDLKVVHYLDYYAGLVGLRRKERVRQVEEVLELTDLQPKREALVGGLSRGVKQRLCLAKTLLHDPLVLLLDEPASGLDPRARIEIRVLLQVLKRDMGKTIVISSHILEDLEEICERVAVYEAGKVVATGAVTDLKEKARGAHRYVIEPRGDVAAAAARLEACAQVESVIREQNRLTLVPTPEVVDDAPILRALLEADVRVRTFREESPDLHDVFLELTRGEVS